MILNAIGTAYFFGAYYDKALMYVFESLALREQDGDSFEISTVLSNIGLIFQNLADYDRALFYYSRSLKLMDESNQSDGREATILNIAICYIYKKDFEQAQRYIKMGRTLTNASELFVLSLLNAEGMAALWGGDYREAETKFKQSYQHSTKVGFERNHLDNISYLLQIYLSNNDINSAEKYLREAERLISSGFSYHEEIIEVYKRFISFYSNLKNFEKMAYYQQKYNSLKELLYSKDVTTNLMRIEAQHLEKENQAKIAAQNKNSCPKSRNHCQAKIYKHLHRPGRVVTCNNYHYAHKKQSPQTTSKPSA